MRTLLHYGLQPVVLGATLWLSASFGSEVAYPIVLFGVVGGLFGLERLFPRRLDWLQTPSDLRSTASLVLAALAVGGLLTFGYQDALSPRFAELRAAHGFDFWPRSWPMAAQIILAVFASEFGWYWLHRAEHRFAPVWRATGHGVHHSFQHLGALHVSANHPFELPVLLLPSIVLGLLFGAGEAAEAAGVLVLANSSLAHCNLDLNSRGVDWLFTTRRHHIHHHSSVRSESNTNYGCAVMLWDRVFGTFEDADTEATGIGPSEPTTAEKFRMPFREPSDIRVAPGVR